MTSWRRVVPLLLLMYGALAGGLFAGRLLMYLAAHAAAFLGASAQGVTLTAMWTLRAVGAAGVWIGAVLAARRWPALSPRHLTIGGVAGFAVAVPAGHLLAWCGLDRSGSLGVGLALLGFGTGLVIASRVVSQPQRSHGTAAQ
jgi:hypothetical protein